MLIKASGLNSGVLFVTLKLNAIFSGLTGLILILFSETMAALLGSVSSFVLSIIGLTLILFSLRLIHVSLKGEIRRIEVLSIVISDFLWVVGSISFLLTIPLFFTEVGKWIIIATAIIVMSFAEFQLYGLWKVRRT